MKILIADAVTHNRKHLASYLLESGLNVVGTAASGEETRQQVIDLEPDVVIMDINLPDVDVLEFITKLTVSPDAAVVILLLVSHDPEIERRGLKAGAYACLAKNDGIDPLVEAIQKIQITHFQGE